MTVAIPEFATAPMAFIHNEVKGNGGYAGPPNPEDFGRQFFDLLLNSKASSTAPAMKSGARLILIDADNQTVSVVAAGPDKNKKTESVASSAGEILTEIRARLGLTITQTAELFNITRKTVYDWYEGSAPRSGIIARLELLIELLHGPYADVDLTRLKNVWNFPASGVSFRDLFNDGDLDNAQLKGALARKIDELSSRLVVPHPKPSRRKMELGTAHLVDIDRSSDIG